MSILLLGDGPRLAWVRSVLDAMRARAPVSAQSLSAVPEIRVVEGPPTRDLLVSLAAGTIDSLILVDHGLLAAGPPPAAVDPAEAIRGEALRAVFAVELARRAARTLVLSGGDTQAWVPSLAALLVVPLPGDLPGPCPLPARPGKLVATPLLQTYLQPLVAAAGNPAPLVLTWPRESFLDGDDPGSCLPAMVEVAGRARIVAYGPYLPLPAGRWHATAFLGFSPDIGNLPFILEADTGGTVARGFFEVERGGIFTLKLDFQVADALHPVELRLISQDSALEGQLALIEVKLEQFSAP
jgi:hypothetical protein